MADRPMPEPSELQELLDLAPVAVIVRAFGTDEIVLWRRGARELYGWTPEEALGQVTHELLQTRFPISKEAVDAALRSTGHWAGELTHTRKDGEAVVVASRQAVQPDANGRPSLTLEINSDITERKNAEERFRLLVDNVVDYAIFLLSTDGTVLTWNEGAERLKGYAPAEIIGQSFTRFYTPEDVEGGLPATLLAEATAQGRAESEGWRVRKDGSRFWANAVITALRDQSGRLRGFAKITRDLSVRKEMEDARARASREEGARAAAEASQVELRTSRDQLAAILAGVAEGIMTQDPSGRIVYANDMAARLCGFSDAQAFLSASVPEIIGRFELFDEKGDPVAREQLPAQRLLRGEPVSETTLRFHPVGGQGEERWSVVNAAPLRDEHGRIRQVISIFRDVSERKVAEDTARFLAAVNLELVRSLDYEETLRRVAELAVPALADWCAVDILGDDGVLRRVASAHADPDKIQLAQERIEAITHAAQDREMLDALQLDSVIIVPLVARGTALGSITLVAAESGRHYTQRDLAVVEDLAARAALAVDNARLYRDAQQQAAMHVELNAALRSAMTQLEQNSRTRDEFLASAAHDLKNPLASIKGLAQLLQRRARHPQGLSEARLEEGLQRINEVVTRATLQVEELLDIARLQMGRPLDIDAAPTDLVATAREVLAEHEHRNDRHQLTFESDVVELVGLWDQRRLMRAIGNLVDNAIKYSPNGGQVRLRLSREHDPDVAVLSVQDEGLGIPEADVARIFERFERGANVMGEIAGTGIGLTSVRHIVESHGGSIAVSSQPGHGTTFTVRLPLSRGAAE